MHSWFVYVCGCCICLNISFYIICCNKKKSGCKGVSGLTATNLPFFPLDFLLICFWPFWLVILSSVRCFFFGCSGLLKSGFCLWCCYCFSFSGFGSVLDFNAFFKGVKGDAIISDSYSFYKDPYSLFYRKQPWWMPRILNETKFIKKVYVSEVMFLWDSRSMKLLETGLWPVVIHTNYLLETDWHYVVLSSGEFVGRKAAETIWISTNQKFWFFDLRSGSIQNESITYREIEILLKYVHLSVI